MSKLPLSFLTVGLPLDHPSVPEHMRERIRQAVTEAQAQYKRCNCDIQGFTPSPEGDLSDLVSRLQSHKLDGVVIGFGVRSNPDHTVLFERIVDAVRTHAPQAKLMFNSSPTNTLAAIQRSFPEVKEVT